eukprot:CAMPEP_0177609820 /NCGR_PEP_ID=MMETSP0419_2-20121207/19359_1 /TAXON_ID=582737 /ORGANISM="Tetraselmis sp., Strain GSL018" /LENGTH=641 /DNA_ID=CAMNT_0019104903 /DNA_START=286 /DNA_END=2211 /DNA_ORIENTATION=-
MSTSERLSDAISDSGTEKDQAQGVTIRSDGTVKIVVWAPFASSVELEISSEKSRTWTAPGEGPETNEPDVTANDSKLLSDYVPEGDPLPLHRRLDDSGNWELDLSAGLLKKGTPYRLRLNKDHAPIYRRDPYARATDYDSKWCYADDGGRGFEWADWQPRPFDENIIYEMHVGSFTPEGTLQAAAEKLDHIAGAGFTSIELMPLAEFSYATERWGYNPRQLLALHGPYGKPDDLRHFVNEAHKHGLGVIVDVVLHHGAVAGNELWDFDGWGGNYFGEGGIYHEGAHDGPWGRSLAHWKREVRDMIKDACSMWLGEYRCDGLRFDSANDLPWDYIPEWTGHLHSAYNGCLLIAEITPENPEGIHRLGFDSLWTHSGYFDIIQQHRALGRGHHGGGDWAEGWNFPRLRTAMGLHYGFTWPTQCVKYMTGSHDQVGCQNGGGHYEDLAMIGGQKRYFTDQCGGGRHDATAAAAQRLWYAANVGAAGLPMMMMGTEWMQTGWWNPDEERRLNWELADDDAGKRSVASVRDVNALRERFPALRTGWCKILHEDRMNGVLAFERAAEGVPRVVVVVNAGLQYWQGKEYGVWVHGGVFQQVYCSQDPAYSGSDHWVSNDGEETIQTHDEKLWLNIPPSCTMLFHQVSL